MRSKNWMKLPSLLLLGILVLQAPLANAAPKVCFAKPEAQKMLVEIKYGQITADRLEICQKSYSTAKMINKNDATLITGLKQDKSDLTSLSNEYKERYIKANEEAVNAAKNKPSRFTWFGIGFLTAAVLGIVGAFAISK